MSIPLVSIGITSYNRPETLKQTLQSAIEQTYKNIEIIVSDDCSTKNKQIEETIQDFLAKDSRIKYFKQLTNRGFNFNSSFVLSKSTGLYFMWLCDDDWIDKNYIEYCYEYLEKNKDYVLVCGTTKFYNGSEYLFDGVKINVEDEDNTKRLLSFYTQQLGSTNLPNYGLIRREFLLNHELKNIIGHDNIIFANIAYTGKFKTLDNIYFHRRLGGISISLENIATYLKLPLIQRRFPHIILWGNIFKDVTVQSRTLSGLSFLKRLLLACKLTVLILLNLEKHLGLYKMRFVRSKSQVIKNSRLNKPRDKRENRR